MHVHISALKHGISKADITHVYEHPITFSDLEPNSDPPKVLIIGADNAGNLLEVIFLVLEQDELLAIHAMRLRPAFYPLLPDPTEMT